MLKSEFIKEISERCELPKDKSAEVFQAFNDLINEIIATNDSMKFDFGTIEGIIRPPIKITGKIIFEDKVKANGYWSNCKIGVPKIIWSKDAKTCVKISPFEWFNYVENRYSEDAKKFRETNDLPEIDLEHEDISEITRMPENIKEVYDRYIDRLSKGASFLYRNNREKQAFDDKLISLREKRKNKKKEKEKEEK